MKKITLLLGIILLTASILAQTPQAFKYQAVARDHLGDIITDQDIGLRITILAGGPGGTPVYVETHQPHTNQFGLFSVNIGQGTVVSGNFSNNNWGNNTYFLQTEMDQTGGTTYALMGVSQLLSVPYALYSENTANVNDADPDPTNEIQTISKNGKYIELSNGGGSVMDEVNDIDADPYNEIQDLTRTNLDITLSNGGGTVSIADDDNDPANELQTLSKAGSTIILSPGGGSVNDDVNDADPDPTNELQSLSILGNNLTLSKGNTISLPTELPSGSLGKTLFHSGTEWLSTNNLYNNGNYIGIGTTAPSHVFEVDKPVYGGIMSVFTNTALGAGSAAIKSEAAYDTWAYIGVQGETNFDGHLGMNINGNEIAFLGVSTGTSTTDNYGLYGYSNGYGVFGKYSTTTKEGYLGGPSYGAYGQYTDDKYGYLGGSLCGAYGQYNSDRYGYLGGPNAAVVGINGPDISGALGCSFYGVSGNAEIHNGTQVYGGWFTARTTNSICIGVLNKAEYEGTITPPVNAHVTGISNNVESSIADQYGIFNEIDHTGTSGEVNSIYSYVDIVASHSDIGRGIVSFSMRGSDSYSNYGMYTYASNGTNVYGIYAGASSGSTNTYAGYFSGNVTVTGTFSNPSDIKFKQDLNAIDNPLDKIKKLNAYTYYYKSDEEAEKMNFNEGLHYGFVAQEMENVFPDLVSDEVHSYDEMIIKYGKKVPREHSFKYKGINYIEMIPILTQAIKDQQEIIENQQSAIDQQQKEIDELKKMMK